MTASQAPVAARDVPLASWTQSVGMSALQDALKLASRPGIISFALGLPSPELFPIEKFKSSYQNVLLSGSRTLQYGRPSEELKSHLVSVMRRRGIRCKESEIFLTQGAQQAIHLLAKLLMDNGRQIITENLCYPGFWQNLKFYAPEALLVSTDPQSGMDVERVGWFLKSGSRPALIYVIPDGHNPTGASLSEEKREYLLRLARFYGTPLLEEDPYGLLSYLDGQTVALRARDHEQVFYVGSMSKILAPSLRIGWLVAPERYMPYLEILKESSDINMATLSQHVVANMLANDWLSPHLATLQIEYKQRRDAMLTAIHLFLPSGSECVAPNCGIYIWVRLPGNVDTRQFLEAAVSNYGVSFMPGDAFCIGERETSQNCMRLSFSSPSVDQITEGLNRLSDAISSCGGCRSIAR
jgi:2-aminoadipate transaminase